MERMPAAFDRTVPVPGLAAKTVCVMATLGNADKPASAPAGGEQIGGEAVNSVVAPAR
jgi:hypothetical protein